MVPFESLVWFPRSNHGSVVYHLQDTVKNWPKIAIFSYPSYTHRPCCVCVCVGGGSRQNIAIPFGTEKLEWCGYPTVKEVDDMFSRFDRIPACDRRTD